MTMPLFACTLCVARIPKSTLEKDFCVLFCESDFRKKNNFPVRKGLKNIVRSKFSFKNSALRKA